MGADSHLIRAREIVSGLPLDRRIALLSGADMWHTVGVPEAGVESVMVADGPHGLRKQSGSSGGIGFAAGLPATCFPPAATLACSWDPALAGEVGRAIGEEARAAGVAVVLGPGLNLKRHPCCGRNFEYYSEDPLLSGRIAAGFVNGVQSVGIGACLKHFAVNNQESNRMVVDVIVDERTLRELYLAGFEIAVKEASPWTVMCAYNLVNGTYCADSHRLLTEILRDEWGFDGLVMSDWGATNDRAAGIAAGLDLEMPGSQGANDVAVRSAIAEGRLAEADVTEAAARVVALALQAAAARDAGASAHGQATDDGSGAPGGIGFDADAHHALARRAAAESTVLLSNDGLLPLAADQTIAVIGAMASEPRYQGTGSSQVTPTRLERALDAIRERAADAGGVAYVPAYEPTTGDLLDGALPEAIAAARAASVAIVLCGLPPTYESEGFDRSNMRLPGGHDRLVEAVCAANPRTAVVLLGGSPMELPWAGRPAAILACYLGGQAGGAAIADIVFGDAEPTGRLAETWPLALADVPADANFPGAPRQVEYREGIYVGYRHFSTADAPVRYCFGHGLGYTAFEFGQVRLSADRVGAGEGVVATVPVTNVGERAGTTVVQIYVSDPVASVHRPSRELAGFARAHLEAGASAEVTIAIGSRAFQFWDAPTAEWQTEGGEFEVLAAASADDVRSRATLTVDSAFAPVSLPAPPGHVADDIRFAALLGRAVPRPADALPYHRTSTVGDLGQTWLGRVVQRGLLRSLMSRVGDTLASDPTLAVMLERAVQEMPLRSLVTMSDGAVGWRALDALLEVLNGRWGAALARALGR